MPGSTSAGMAEKKASKAASPPAEAPMPTMGKSFTDSRADGSSGLSAAGFLFSLGTDFFVLAIRIPP